MHADALCKKSNYMEFESARLHFKEITWSDLDHFHKLHTFPEVDAFNTLGIPGTLDDTKDVLRPMIEAQLSVPRKWYTWKVLSSPGTFIGEVGMILSLDKFRLGEIYYKLMPDQWGNGYGTEISRTLIKTGFDIFHLHKVEAGVATDNVRSIHVLEKSGMTREGLRRKILPIRGEWKDNYHYAIVEDDPRDY
jgi:RimJ/RimL family protein N-acetyltransferase